MDNSDKIGVIALVVLFLAWFIYFFVINKHEKVKLSKPIFEFNVSQTSYMIAIIVLLLIFMIRQEVQIEDLQDQISEMHSDLSGDIQDIEDAVYSRCD
jgi:uncharacterized membrane protein (DUF485 family)